MVLHNVTHVSNKDLVTIHVDHGIIEAIGEEVEVAADPFHLFFQDAIVFPGLINSHDHLDFNLFPMLGDRQYSNYTEWGRHIHEVYEERIQAVLRIPVDLRVQWGIYKNLVCGVTTVINHGSSLALHHPLITVCQQMHNLHSVKFEKYWKLKLNNPFKRKYPYAIHTGEGTDQEAEHEIDELIECNHLKKKIVGIHGVAMSERQAQHFKGLVWCPASNYFLLHKTAGINHLKKYTNTVFGTDSTLTSNWNIWEHIRLARTSSMVTDLELFEMLTSNAAKLWRLNTGQLASGKIADLVIAKKKVASSIPESLFSINPQDLLLVVHGGKIRLAAEELYYQLLDQDFSFAEYSEMIVNDAIKYVQGDLPALLNRIRTYNPGITFPVSTL